MPGKKISLIGSSNLHTNKTCQFGSMAGLAPTKNLRPWITSLHAYKYSAALNDKNNYTFGCGYNRNCKDGKRCVKKIGFTQNVVQHRTGMKHLR